MKATQLFSYHQKHARLTEFAGYEMPLWYTTTTEEHLAVRNSCGVFDVSHMGRFPVKGPSAEKFLERLVPTDVHSQRPGKAFYTLFLNDKGGIVDDLIIERESDTEFLVVANAANAQQDFAHMTNESPSEGVQIEDMTSSSAMIAMQGPLSASVLQPMTPLDLGQLKRFRCAHTEVARTPTVISRRGYTGEDGYELVIPGATVEKPNGAIEIWEKLLQSSRACGLAARDSLRLEAGLPLHGSDIGPETNPYEADLGWVVSAEKNDYVGFDAIADLRQSPPDVIKRGAVLSRGIPRHGFEIFDLSSDRIGVVTSGSYSPILKQGIALCSVKQERSEPGSRVKVRVREIDEEGRLVRPPFYDENVYGWKRTTQR